jgi:hypothetical protein
MESNNCKGNVIRSIFTVIAILGVSIPCIYFYIQQLEKYLFKLSLKKEDEIEGMINHLKRKPTKKEIKKSFE